MMRSSKKSLWKGFMVAIALVLFVGVSSTAFASSTYFTSPPNYGTPSSPIIFSYSVGGDEFFNWAQPAGTTHYSLNIYHSGGTYTSGLSTTTSTSGHHFIPNSIWSTIPHNEVMQATINTYQYVTGTGYVHNGGDYTYITVIPSP